MSIDWARVFTPRIKAIYCMLFALGVSACLLALVVLR